MAVRSASSAVTTSTGTLDIAAVEHTVFGLAGQSASQAPLGRRNQRAIAPTRPLQPPTVVEDAVQLPDSFVTELRAPCATENQPLSARIESRVAPSNAELLDRIDDVLSSTSDSESAPSISVAPSSTNGTTENVALVERVFNWTVKNPGKVVPPTCNDYDSWTVAQLRKECTERKLRLARATSKQDQIRHLRSYDATKRAVQASIDSENLLDPSMRKTKHCFIRLSNVLFSDRFAERLAHSDDALTRGQIEAGAVNAKTVFWKEVGVEHRTNKRDYNNLFEAAASDPRFSGINPSYIVQHDDARLYDMWKKGNGSFVKANAKFYVSGQNSEDFYEFCDGNLDAAYLEICTRVKPELAAFVKGGMRPEDEIDSMNLPGSHSEVPASKSVKWQDQVIRTVNRIADMFGGTPVAVASAPTRSTEAESRGEDRLIDRIGKMHQLIEQVKERQRKDALSGTTDPTLAVSLRKYQQRLQHYEDQLDALL